MIRAVVAATIRVGVWVVVEAKAVVVAVAWAGEVA